MASPSARKSLRAFTLRALPVPARPQRTRAPQRPRARHLLVAPALLASLAAAPAQAATISGVVIQQEATSWAPPFAGAEVRALRPDGSTAASTTTSSEGTYTLTVPRGKYVVWADEPAATQAANDYAEAYYGSPWRGKATTIALPDEQSAATGAEVNVPRWATLGFRLLDEVDDTPLVGVKVASYPRGLRSLVGTEDSSTVTSADGRFSLKVRPMQEMFVWAEGYIVDDGFGASARYALATREVQPGEPVEPGGVTPPGVFQGYHLWPGVPFGSSFAFARVPVRTAEVTVTDPLGGDWEADVTLYDADHVAVARRRVSSASPTAQLPANNDRYSIGVEAVSGTAAGGYAPVFSGGASTLQEAHALGNDSQTTLALRPLGRLQGTVQGPTIDGVRPLPGAGVRILRGGAEVARAVTGADGAWSVSALPLSDPYEPAYTAEFTAPGFGARTLPATVTATAAGQLDATLTADPGTLAGVVRDSAGAPLAGVKVELFGASGSAVAEQTTDAAGHFAHSVAPGRWRLALSRTGYVAAAFPGATTIAIASGGGIDDLDLRLAAVPAPPSTDGGSGAGTGGGMTTPTPETPAPGPGTPVPVAAAPFEFGWAQLALSGSKLTVSRTGDLQVPVRCASAQAYCLAQLAISYRPAKKKGAGKAPAAQRIGWASASSVGLSAVPLALSKAGRTALKAAGKKGLKVSLELGPASNGKVAAKTVTLTAAK